MRSFYIQIHMKNNNSVTELEHVSLGNYVTSGRKFQDNSLIFVLGLNVKTSLIVGVLKMLQM